MHSLRTKITGVTVVAILASLITAAVAGFLTVGREVTTSSAEKMHLMAVATQRSLDAYLNDLEQATKITSQIETSSLDSLLLVECGANIEPEKRTSEQTDRLDKYLSEHIETVKDSFGKVASHTNGVKSYFYCIEPAVSTKEHGFFFMRTGKVGFEELEPIDVGKLVPDDMEHNAWYFDAVEQGVPMWVDPYKNAWLDDAPTVSYLMPVYRAGVFVGLMGMDILLDTLAEQIKNLQVYTTGYACLLDDKGNVLYHPEYDAENIPASESEAFSEGMMIDKDSGNKAILYDKGGESWQMSYSTLANGMKLVVTAPAGEVAESWHRLVGIVPWIGIAILALFVPFVLLASGAVTRPLQQLTAGANRFVAGDYEVEFDYSGDDEVGKLIEAFRALREHLQVYTSNLSSASFSDKLTGVKNKRAFDMYAAQVNDSFAHAGDGEGQQFALAVIDCLDVSTIRDDFGSKWADVSIQTTCKLACQIYSEASVFRLDECRFVAFLQGRNYANREELFFDFDIWAEETNAAATEPWLQVHVAMGMATYRPGEDKSVAEVLERAIQRTERT